MENLTIHNPNFITYGDDLLSIDVLGGVDLNHIERLVCTLRISYQNSPPYRTTIDLYNDNQSDKLIRTLCDKWEQDLISVSKAVHRLIIQLEKYRLENLHYTKKEQAFILDSEDRQTALKLLKSKTLLKQLGYHLNQTGIIGEDENALILFMAMASYRSANPFSVICLAKSGIGKSYILQKLSACAPDGSYSFHTHISENAIYYFKSDDIHQKMLFVEDLEWTTTMLQPLATLQTQGRLIKTRATKNKDGMLHSTTFEVKGKPCLLACAYSDKNYEGLSLPFLMLHLNHSHTQDIAIMEYQKRCKAGLIKNEAEKQTQHLLKCLIASLENVSIINPYAELVNLPNDIAHPRKSLLLLLNFIETITFFHQHQREQLTDEETGEVFIQTHPDDIALAFKLLKNSLFRRADELSTTTRGFYRWLTGFLNEAKTNQFTALDIRKAKAIHPRTLNRYLQELKLYAYVQVAGGNKHREGYRYKLTAFGNQSDVQNRIEKELKTTLEVIQKQYRKEVDSKQETGENEADQEPQEQGKHPQAVQEQETDIIKTDEVKEPKKQTQTIGGTEATYQTICAMIKVDLSQSFTTEDICNWTGKKPRTAMKHLKALAEKGLLNRIQSNKNKAYSYTLTHNTSKTVSQNPITNPQTQTT